MAVILEGLIHGRIPVMATSLHGPLKRAKITGFRFHDLRHTFATRLAQPAPARCDVQYSSEGGIRPTLVGFLPPLPYLRRAPSFLCRSSRSSTENRWWQKTIRQNRKRVSLSREAIFLDFFSA